MDSAKYKHTMSYMSYICQTVPTCCATVWDAVVFAVEIASRTIRSGIAALVRDTCL